MEISSIDDLLNGIKSGTKPETPENQVEYDDSPDEPVVETADDDDSHETEYSYDDEESQGADEKTKTSEADEYGNEYGNEKEPENKHIRERLAKQAKKHQAEIDSLRAQLSQQGASQQVQQAASDFKYDPDESGDWQQQLASFVKQTVNSMSREKEEHAARNEEARVQYEFETKFKAGMDKFDDFIDVMTELEFEITTPMTIATRGMDNPAAFLYAAARRNPQDLGRISKIRDPYVQMTEIGKLEERMRKSKPATKAPRPLGHITADSTAAIKKKEPDFNGDDLLARADSKRLNSAKQRIKANR